MFKIENVTAMYPRIDKTYRFDNTENRSVPCDPLDDGAAYELSFAMTKDQAKALYKAMVAAYKENRKDDWPEKLELPFKETDDGMFVGKTKLKGAYGKDVTKKPAQYDAAKNKLPDDFQLTSNSTVNIAVTFVPYNMRDHGVSLRLNAVQVVKLAEAKGPANPFDAVDGYDSKEGVPFEILSRDELDSRKEEEPDEPKKVTKKKATPPPKDNDLASIVDDWDD